MFKIVFVATLICFMWSHFSWSSEPEVYSVYSKVIRKNEMIFRTDGNVLMIDIHILENTHKEWERVLGPMPLKNQAKEIRSIQTVKLKNLGIHSGLNINYINFNKQAVEHFIISETSFLKMYKNEYYDPSEQDPVWWIPFQGFGILMSSDKDPKHKNASEFKYNGLGYIGKNLELTPGELIQFPSCVENEKLITELAPVIDKLKKDSSIKLVPNEKLQECMIQGQKFIKLKESNLYLIELGPKKYAYWKSRPSGEYSSTDGYGIWIKGSLLNFIYNTGPTAYLVIIYPNKIEEIELYHTEGYKG